MGSSGGIDGILTSGSTTAPTAAQMVVAIDNWLMNRLLSGGQQEYRIMGKSITYFEPDKLLRWREVFKAQADREEVSGGGNVSVARFVR